MKVICECLSLSDPILWRLSGGGRRKIKKKSEEKNLGRNYKTSRPMDGMPKYIDRLSAKTLFMKKIADLLKITSTMINVPDGVSSFSLF